MLPFISCLNQGQGTTYITEHRPISIQHWSMYDAEGRSGEMLDVVFNSNLIKTSVAGCRSCSGKRAKERTPTQKKRERHEDRLLVGVLQWDPRTVGASSSPGCFAIGDSAADSSTRGFVSFVSDYVPGSDAAGIPRRVSVLDKGVR